MSCFSNRTDIIEHNNVTSKLKYMANLLPKSKMLASEGEETGRYPFYTSSERLTLRTDIATYDEESLILGTGGTFSIHYCNEPFSTSTDCLVLLTNIYTRFLYYFLVSQSRIIDDIGFYGMGLRHLQRDFLLSINCPTPSCQTQQAIADYLDLKTSQIDSIISNLTNQNKKLSEYRKSLISEAVTKGLDKTVKMKDSGIPWIGQIPEDWEIKRLKDYFVFRKGEKSALYTKDYIDSHSGEYPVYSGQTESRGIMGMIDSFDCDFDECLFTTTVGANAMSTKLLKGKFSLSQNCLIMLKKEVCECRFVNYLLQPLFDYEKSKIPSTTQPSLRCIDLNFYQLCMPSINTQQAIANYLDLKTSQMDSIIEDQEKLIELLKEYRKSVISEAVTGKVIV